MSPATLLLTSGDVRRLVTEADCIDAVEAAFRRHDEVPIGAPSVLGFPLPEGGFHVKAAALALDRPYFAVKLNGNFPRNPARFGLPTIQGVVALADADDGRLLALMDSIEITRLRTGAATAVAAKYLARPDSATVMLFGCGRQAGAQLACLRRVLPIRRVLAFDSDPAAAASFAAWAGGFPGIQAEAVADGFAMDCAVGSDVIITCTSSRTPFLTRAHVGAGTFVAAVGADDSTKQELEPELMAEATVVADVLEQCLQIGDLHHAVAAGALAREAIHAELAELVTGRKPGRRRVGEITIFDSTGTALEDVAVAALAYQRAIEAGGHAEVALAAS